MQQTERRYSEAIELYRTSDMPIKEICSRESVSTAAFSSYLRRRHRDLLFARHGIEISPEEARKARLRKKAGQTPAAHAKYREAVMTCDDVEYIDYNISQIAAAFGLSPQGLGRQLRNHFPEILERREKERNRLGINDSAHRGVKPLSARTYAEAVNHLRDSDDTIRQTADLFGVSFNGLREHILFYHKDVVGKRAAKREQGKGEKEPGKVTGKGNRHLPDPGQVEKYKEAVNLCRTTLLTRKQIAEATGVSEGGLGNYLRMWCPELTVDKGRKTAAQKYAGAIKRLKESGLSTAEVAREFNLSPEAFRAYLHTHEPEIAEKLGMAKSKGGKTVLTRTADKYEEAIRLYETTSETLKSIASRLGLKYNSLGGYVRRNHPDSIEKHNRIAEKEKSLR